MDNDGLTPRRALPVRRVVGGLGSNAERTLPNIVDDPDDRPHSFWIDVRVAGGESHCQRIFARQILTCERPIDDDHGWRLDVVVTIEVAAGDDFDTHRDEESRADDTLSRVEVVRRIRIILQVYEHCILRTTAQRQIERRTGCHDPA